MTRFTVVWQPRAQDQLARIWLDSNFRADITAASDQIDAELRINPEEKGRSISDHLWSVRVGPLVVVFEISNEDRIVIVWRVKLKT